MSLIKTEEEIKKMREGGKILARVVKKVGQAVKVGISTKQLDDMAEQLIAKAGGAPSFKGYQGYPAASCISVNNEVVHGIPRADKILHEGDVVGIDIGLLYQGMFTDMARTVIVGQGSRQTKKLIEVTAKALHHGIKEIKAGKTTGDFGHEVQRFAEKHGFSVVRSLVGHGVGRAVHEPPQVPNYGSKGTGTVLEEGMTVALEPMINIGKHEVATHEDGWTISTVDGSTSAHFEDTVLVTKRGVEILTK